MWLARSCTSTRRAGQHALEQQLDAPAARRSLAGEPGGEDASVVADEQVAGSEQRWQIRETPVFDCARRAVEHEQPARAALGERRLRDQIAR